jgi:hypothetical protein
VRWVFVRDRDGTHRDEYLFTTDATMVPRAVIETYTGRWNIEKDQPHYTSNERWCGVHPTGYHQRRGAA